MSLPENLPQPAARLIQIGLRQLGYYRGTTRGIPGPNTRDAYSRYLQSLKQTTGFAEALATAAESQVGIKEQGNNGGPDIRKYQASTWYEPAAWPWCAAFVCWCWQQAALIADPGLQRPTTPGAWDFENWARRVGAKLIKPYRPKTSTPDTLARRGDIVIFTFSHIGIVVADQLTGLDALRTVEGNTNPGGSREGDGVYQKTRPPRKVRSLIRAS